ncbi:MULTISPECIES: hypothetical protein [unclassified Luteimonas]
MRFRNAMPALVAVAIATAATPAIARQAGQTEGFLCCNMRAFDGEIYDINYDDEGARIVPFGSPLTVTRQDRRKLRLLVDGKRHVIENHYSRDLSEAEFAARYVVAEDPRIAAAGFPDKIREAIASARITPGMTREQVAMSLGWPVSSENPNLEAEVWRFWLSSFDEIQVEFDANGLVMDASASPVTRRKIWLP